MDDLSRDIALYRTIRTSAKAFIAHKNLTRVNLPRRKPKTTDLPVEAHIGEIYLIKGDNIIQYYSCWKQASLYVQVNHTRPMWMCETTIINKELGDPEHLKFLLSGCEILTNIEETHECILGFLEAGFVIWKK